MLGVEVLRSWRRRRREREDRAVASRLDTARGLARDVFAGVSPGPTSHHAYATLADRYTADSGKPYPHCDSLVLHRASSCTYCADRPDLQDLRRQLGIANTGVAPGPGQMPCPAETHRPVEKIESWPGNAPRAEGEPPASPFG